MTLKPDTYDVVLTIFWIMMLGVAIYNGDIDRILFAGLIISMHIRIMLLQTIIKSDSPLDQTPTHYLNKDK